MTITALTSTRPRLPRRSHYTAESLSQAALETLHRGLRARATFRAIAAQIEQETGEKINAYAVRRYARHVESELQELRQAEAQARAFTAEIAAGNISAADVGQALITQALFEQRDSIRRLPAADLLMLQQRGQLISLKAGQVAAAERRAAAYAATHPPPQAATAGAEPQEELTESEKAKIRSIYGIE